ncbi:MAG: DUF1549 domain-containing protein [Planctomycetaceae bacterium]|nr:DUF1549 domain-containing protein [Planctomycetaceae bacterium]
MAGPLRRLAVGTLCYAAVALAGATLRAEEATLREIIDREVAAGWARQQIGPAQPSGDAEFLRRVYLDLVGVIPAYAETVAFLAFEL